MSTHEVSIRALHQRTIALGKSIASPGTLRITTSVLAVVLMFGCFASVFAQHYQQTNLVSDISGLAPVPDANLVNPWGLTSSGTSPWWVSDNGTGVATLYNGAGQRIPLVVTVPPPFGGVPPSAPTGIVFNGSSAFGAALFIFVTEDGTISGWSGGTNAALKFTSPVRAVYKGATIGQSNSANFLYVANFFNGSVDVFDKDYVPVTLSSGAFKDSRIPSGFAPFNVQNIGGKIFVTYAKQSEAKKDEVDGPGLGFVDVYNPNGDLVLGLKSGRWLNSPWGLALAPGGFGKDSGRLLVGQFGSGQIATYDLDHGNFHGLLRGVDGQPLKIDGLWALRFGNGAGAGPATTLFFTAGIEGEAHGLFGTITPILHDDDDGD
jgi:uncharacterized protein (TIGR03118 family)